MVLVEKAQNATDPLKWVPWFLKWEILIINFIHNKGHSIFTNHNNNILTDIAYQ